MHYTCVFSPAFKYIDENSYLIMHCAPTYLMRTSRLYYVVPVPCSLRLHSAFGWPAANRAPALTFAFGRPLTRQSTSTFPERKLQALFLVWPLKHALYFLSIGHIRECVNPSN